MSEKTEQINAIFDEMFEIQQKLDVLSKQKKQEFYDGQPDLDEETVRNLDEISFQMEQNLKNLKFLFLSLYSYNGKSTSYVKKQASRENGKKGGRSPKRITDAKKQLLQLQQRMEQIESILKMSDDVDELNALQQENELLQQEKKKCLDIISEGKKPQYTINDTQ